MCASPQVITGVSWVAPSRLHEGGLLEQCMHSYGLACYHLVTTWQPGISLPVPSLAMVALCGIYLVVVTERPGVEAGVVDRSETVLSGHPKLGAQPQRCEQEVASWPHALLAPLAPFCSLSRIPLCTSHSKVLRSTRACDTCPQRSKRF